MSAEGKSLALRTLVVTGTVAFVAIFFVLLWYVAEVLLLAFAGVLVATFLRGLAHLLCEYTNLSEGWALVIVILSLVAISALGAWLLLPELVRQAGQLVEQLPRSVDAVRNAVEGLPWAQELVRQFPVQEIFEQTGKVIATITSYLGAAFNALVQVIIVLFIGLYFSIQPGLYLSGFIRLFPMSERGRAAGVLDSVATTLQWWLLGRMVDMIVVGVMTTIGLYIIGAPLALTLGIIAALLNFIPYIGPFLGAVPAILVGLGQSFGLTFNIIILFVIVQALESYLLVPLIERKSVYLPPALALLAQVLMALLAGALGVILASPLAAIGMVLVNKLYLQDILGETPEEAESPGTAG